MQTKFQNSHLPFRLSNPDLLCNQLYINGEWKQSASGKEFPVQDPGTGKNWMSCPDSTPDDVDPAVQAAHAMFRSYSQLNPRKRAELLASWHRLLVSSRDDLAKILVRETGKPLSEAYGELDYGICFTWWFTGEADRIQGSTFTSAAPNRRTITIKQPISVAVAMVPWNSPIALVLRKASVALAADARW
jgi:acyl-CoA reductase-like NAD-dependent aldehyde dehydrogenase